MGDSRFRLVPPGTVDDTRCPAERSSNDDSVGYQESAVSLVINELQCHSFSHDNTKAGEISARPDCLQTIGVVVGPLVEVAGNSAGRWCCHDGSWVSLTPKLSCRAIK